MKGKEIQRQKERYPPGTYWNISAICRYHDINADTAPIEEIKKLLSSLSIEELCSFQSVGIKKATALLGWAGGNIEPPKRIRRTKTFRLFGKKIKITVSIN